MELTKSGKTPVERMAELAMRLGGLASGRLRLGAQPAWFHAAATAGVSDFAGLRTMGSTLIARTPRQLLAEAAFKVLAYTLRR